MPEAFTCTKCGHVEPLREGPPSSGGAAGIACPSCGTRIDTVSIRRADRETKKADTVKTAKKKLAAKKKAAAS